MVRQFWKQFDTYVELVLEILVHQGN
jgi:hypothetical protein